MNLKEKDIIFQTVNLVNILGHILKIDEAKGPTNNLSHV